MKTVTIYTDGACSGNPGPGGWGAILMYGPHTKELSGGEAVAGAYDPALGERVLSRMYRNRAEQLLSAQPEIRDAVFYVHPRRISVMVGQKRENTCYLRERFGLSSIKVRPIGGAEWDIFLKNQ